MSRKCDLTNKGVQVGNRISHSNIKTKHRFLPNLQKKRLWSDELGRFVSLRLTPHAIRSIDKVGLDQFAKNAGVKLNKF